MKKLKLNLFMVAAVAIAAVTMSFKGLQTSSATLDWYERQPNGSYTLIPGGSTDEPANGCPSVGDELCAKGFAPGTAPSTITDATPAQNRFRED